MLNQNPKIMNVTNYEIIRPNVEEILPNARSDIISGLAGTYPEQ